MSNSADSGVSGYSRGHLAHVRSAIESRLASYAGSPLASIGDGGSRVVLRLTPASAYIAEELKREFGEAVSITVGFKPFPVADVNFGPVLLQGSPSAAELWPVMDVSGETANTQIAGGDSVTGRLCIHNRGKAEINFVAAASVGWLCIPGSLDAAGGYSGAIAPGRRAIRLPAGGITFLGFIVGTASCEANDRYVVEPGAYDVVVPLSIWSAGTQDPDKLLVRTDPVTVTDIDPS